MTDEHKLAVDAIAGTLGAIERIDDTTMAVDAAVCIIAAILIDLPPIERVVAGKLLVTHAAQLLEHMGR